MGRIAVNGVSLNVEIAGEEQGHPALLLLHGFTGSAETWRSHLPIVTPFCTTIAVDLIGHGASDAPADAARYAMEHAVPDLLGILDRLGIERSAVLGYSMGGRVALHLAAAAPGRLCALVLESGSPGIADPGERAARRAADEALAASLEKDGVEAFVDRWERLPLFASQHTLPPGVRLEQRRQRLRNCAIGLANSLRGMGAGVQEPLWDRLAGIDVPTLVIAGALDAKFTAIDRAMAAALPQARLAVLPEAGHAVHLEQPHAFDRLVVAFLRQAIGHQLSAVSYGLTADS